MKSIPKQKNWIPDDGKREDSRKQPDSKEKNDEKKIKLGWGGACFPRVRRPSGEGQKVVAIYQDFYHCGVSRKSVPEHVGVKGGGAVGGQGEGQGGPLTCYPGGTSKIFRYKFILRSMEVASLHTLRGGKRTVTGLYGAQKRKEARNCRTFPSEKERSTCSLVGLGAVQVREEKARKKEKKNCKSGCLFGHLEKTLRYSDLNEKKSPSEQTSRGR